MTAKKAKELVSALSAKFGGTAEAELVGKKGRYRFSLVSPKFRRRALLERQDAIWHYVDQIVSREDNLDITLILAFAPSELATAS